MTITLDVAEALRPGRAVSLPNEPAGRILAWSDRQRWNDMNTITRFALEKHDGPYEKWPVRSRLLADGERTRISLPGYSLLQQFETPYGFILVTDYDCPFEEMTNFALVSTQLRLLSCRWLGWPYSSFLLEGIEWENDQSFIAVLSGHDRWRFTIRPWGIPYIRPRLKMQWLGQSGIAEGQPDPRGARA